MPIFAASSGIVIPGLSFTSASASAPRVPLPFGRPRRPVPLLELRRLAGALAARVLTARGNAVARGGCRLQTLVLLDERLELLEPRADLASLLVQEICHVLLPVWRYVN